MRPKSEIYTPTRDDEHPYHLHMRCSPPPPRVRGPQSIFHSDRADCREDPLSSLAAIHYPFSVYSSHLTTPPMDGKCRLGPKIRPQSLTVRLDQGGFPGLDQAPVVQKADSAVHWINNYPLDSSIGFPNNYPMDSALSDG